MPAADPALGLSGAMAAREQRQQMTAEPQGTGELARAARSLESVQGNVAGQTMAIQSLSMATQSAVLNVGSQMNALSSQLASLNSSLARLSGGMAMSATMTPPPMMMTGGGGGFQMPNMAPFASAVGRGGAGVMGGLGTVGAGLGYMGGSAYGLGNVPAFRTPYGAEMAPGAGAIQALALGSGVGVGRGTMRTMNYDRATQAGRERFGDMAGAGAVAAAGGAASLGLGMMGDFVGSRMIMPALGLSGGSLAGGLAGQLAGGAAMYPVSFLVNQTMEQAGQINKFGQQYGRNARTLGQGRPGRGDRAAFGRTGLDMAINDLTLSSQDVTDITAGMFNNDLARGVRSSSDASDRLRELGRSVKTMARTLGGSYSEMMQTAGELQSIGMTINPETTRRAAFGASSVFGMTERQGMAAAQGLAQPFVGAGLGAQGFGLGLMNQNLANYSIQRGALNPALAAAVGGQSGAAALAQQGNLNFLQGPMGMAMMAGGMNAGGGFNMANISGLSTSQALARGGSMMSQGNLLQLAVTPQQLQQQLAANPQALLGLQLAKAKSTAESMGLGGDKNAVMAVFGQMRGVSGAALEADWKMALAAPAAAREQAGQMASAATSAVTSGVMENRSLTGRAKRWVANITHPFANNVSETQAGIGNMAESFVESLGESVYGTKSVQGMGRATKADISEIKSELKKRGFTSAVKVDRRAKPRRETEEMIEKTFHEDIFMDTHRHEKLMTIKERLKDVTDPEEKAELVEQAMAMFRDDYTKNAAPGSSLEAKNVAIEKLLSRELGINVSAIRAGTADFSSVVSEEMKKDEERVVKYLAGTTDLELGEKKIRSIMASDKFSDYFATDDFKKREKIASTMSKEEKDVARAMSKQPELRDKMKRKMRVESAEESITAGGLGLSTALGGLGIEAPGLLGGAGAVLSELGAMNLGKEDIGKLRKMNVNEGLLKSLELKAGDVGAEDMVKLRDLVGDTDAMKLAEGGLTPSELEEVRGSQIGVDMRGSLTSVEGQGLSSDQASLMLQNTKAVQDLAETTRDLAKIVDGMDKSWF